MAEPESVADKALKKLADQLQCAICLDSYINPKLLHCFHVFCTKCLEPMVFEDQQRLSLHCPTCRQSTFLPAQGVSGLQSAFYVHHLFEIQDALKKVKKGQKERKIRCEKCKKHGVTNFCRDCSKFICLRCKEVHEDWEELSTHEVISLQQLKSDATNLVTPAKKTFYCSKHPEKELDMYCETDNELICQHCIVRTHRDHQYDLVNEAFPKHRDAIASILEPIKQQLSIINEAIRGLCTSCKQITDQRVAIEADIHGRIQQFHEALEARRTQLIGQLDQMTQQKLKILSAQKDELELIQTQLNSCLEFVSESLKIGSKVEILGMKESVMQHMKEMSAKFNPDNHRPKEQADMKFVASSKVISASQQFGQIYKEVVCPEKCHVMEEWIKVTAVGEHSAVTVQTVDSEGNKCVKSLGDTIISGELVHCSNAKRVKCDVKHTAASEYEVNYKPTVKGRHELHIKVQGQHIRASPFLVEAWKKLVTPIRTITGLNQPWSVAVNERGQTIVAEEIGHCVSIYNQNGKKVKMFGQRGSAPGQFNGPRGVAVDRDGNLLITEGGNNRIQKFTADGKLIVAVGRKGEKPCEFNLPSDIGIAPNDKVYVCDQSNHRVQILNPDLTFSSSFGSEGSGDGQFLNLSKVAFDSHGKVYVADCGNHRIQVLTEDGQFLRKFGKKGTGDGELYYPTSVAIDSDNVVYVTELYNHRISLFNSEDHFLRSFGTKGRGPGQFNYPRGVAVDKNDLVYICDHDNRRLQIF